MQLLYAGENVVAKYTTIAQVIRKHLESWVIRIVSALSRIIASCVPGLSAGPKLCDAGFKTLEVRKNFSLQLL